LRKLKIIRDTYHDKLNDMQNLIITGYAQKGLIMKIEEWGKSKILNLIFKPAGFLMGNQIRSLFMNPEKMLQNAELDASQTVLEIGCGPGFFTIPAATIVGKNGKLIAMDVSTGFLEAVEKKVKKANLKNVDIMQKDALNTGLSENSIDKVILFGVIPFPLLPLDKLLPEVYRILKPKGTMSVWLFPPLITYWVLKVIPQPNLFDLLNKNGSIYNYIRK